MPNLLQLIPGAVAQGGAQIVYAEITRPAPQSFADPLYLLEPDWSIEFPITLAEWPACHGNTLPLPGDQALIVVDSRGHRRCVWWDGPMTFDTGNYLTYYITPTNSDVANHKLMVQNPYSPKTATAITAVAPGQVIQDNVTAIGVPGATFIPAGQYEHHVHAVQTFGNQTVQLYADFWEASSTGVHIAKIGTTQISEPLTGTEIEYRLFFMNPNVYTFGSITSRVMSHLHAIVGGNGSSNITLYVGGQSDSHVAFPATFNTASSLYLPGDLITSFATSRAGCLLCNGATYLAANYPALAANCPSLVSGANLTVPDFQGRVVMGAGSGAGLTARSVGDKGGVETYKLTAAESGEPGGTYVARDNPNGGTYGVGAFNIGGGALGLAQYNAGTLQVVVPAADAANAHTNVQPFGVANVFIKT